MLLKDCDSREYDVLVLEVLAQDAALTSMERHRVLQALDQIRAHRARMLDVASQLDRLLGDRDDWIVLHDLRVDDGADGLEFDHLLINRLMQVWVLDSCCFDLHLAISPFGDVVASQISSAVQPPAQPVSSRAASLGGHHQRDGVVSSEAGRETLLTPSPLLAIPERKQAFLRWWVSSGLLPQKLGMTLLPQLIQRIVLADEDQVSRPPEDIVDTDALVSLSALWGECLQLKGRSASISRLRSFTHRIDVKKLRDIGMALAELHHVSRIDWVERLGLSSTELPLHLPGNEFQWKPVDLQAAERQALDEEDNDEAWGAAEALNTMAGTSSSGTLSVAAFLATLKKGHASLQAVPEPRHASSLDEQRPAAIERSSVRGLKASDWQGSPAGRSFDASGSDALQGGIQEGADKPERGSLAYHPDMGEPSGLTGGVGKSGSMMDEVADRMPRCDGCRRWLSKDSIQRYREAQQQSTPGPLLCGRCLKQM